MTNIKMLMLVGILSTLVTSRYQALAASQSVLPLKQRAQIIDDVTAKRINQLLPKLMKETNIDMWLLISREYNEDPAALPVTSQLGHPHPAPCCCRPGPTYWPANWRY